MSALLFYACSRPLNYSATIQQSPVALPAPLHNSMPTIEVTHHSRDKIMPEGKEETYGSCLMIIMIVLFFATTWFICYRNATGWYCSAIHDRTK